MTGGSTYPFFYIGSFDPMSTILWIGGSGGRSRMWSKGKVMSQDSETADDAYAEITSAMESAFVMARLRRPNLSLGELFIALLLLKDRLLEQHISVDGLPPELAEIARQLYSI